MDITEGRPRRWDPVVKLTHWTIVAGIIVNALVTEEGSIPHVWIGYGLAAILATRLLWGLIGPREARFTAFPPSPSRALAHVREILAGRKRDHVSHNPLGALMVYAIWGTLAAIIASGIAMAGIPKVDSLLTAPQAALDGTSSHHGETAEESDEHESEEEEEGPLGEVHEAAVNLLYVLILLHLAGVMFETRRSGRHIAMAMLPGRR